MYLPYSFSEDSWVEWICLSIKYSFTLTKWLLCSMPCTNHWWQRDGQDCPQGIYMREKTNGNQILQGLWSQVSSEDRGILLEGIAPIRKSTMSTSWKGRVIRPCQAPWWFLPPTLFFLFKRLKNWKGMNTSTDGYCFLFLGGFQHGPETEVALSQNSWKPDETRQEIVIISIHWVWLQILP